jgi:hypothetical protein
LLPQRFEFVPVRTLKDGFDAIKEMKVRLNLVGGKAGMNNLLTPFRCVALHWSPQSAW